MRKALILGIIASFFFSFTFLLNRQMHLTGGAWEWSASLRYIFMLPIIFLILKSKKQTSAVYHEIRRQPIKWFLFSTIGFGFFYAPLCFASIYSPSWLIAGTWQITIVAGVIMTPLFSQNKNMSGRFPTKVLFFSSMILLGVLLIQFEEATKMSLFHFITGSMPVLFAAFAYPFGNRKTIQLCSNRLTTLQRIYGMTLCSLPFFASISFLGIIKSGLPSHSQVIQSFAVAIFSGILATLLFFKATDLVSNSPHKLAIIEATQSGEVIFTLLGSILIFKDSIPGLFGILGILLIVLGMFCNCYKE